MPQLSAAVQTEAVRKEPRGMPVEVGADQSSVRAELRRQIAHLERELGETFETAFPRQGFEWIVGAQGGPRVLGVGDLERVRDRLVERISDARSLLAEKVDVEEEHRALVERMLGDPKGYRWMRVRSNDTGERGCSHWHSAPRWGLIGMLLGWWRVKISSGCPLAGGVAR